MYYNSLCAGSRLNEVLQTSELADISLGVDVTVSNKEQREQWLGGQ
jgi:hypothetical protein